MGVDEQLEQFMRQMPKVELHLEGLIPPGDAARPGAPPRRRVTRERHRGVIALVPLPRFPALHLGNNQRQKVVRDHCHAVTQARRQDERFYPPCLTSDIAYLVLHLICRHLIQNDQQPPDNFVWRASHQVRHQHIDVLVQIEIDEEVTHRSCTNGSSNAAGTRLRSINLLISSR